MAGVHWKEPKDCQITENLNRYKLMPESTWFQKQDILLVEKSRGLQGPYFFFQLLDHRSPEGYESYVGEVLNVSKEENKVEMKYRFCSSGHGTYFRTTFQPNMFFNITRINRYQYGKLQRAELHESFLSTAKHEKMSQAAVFDYFCKLKVGDFIYYESKDDDDNGGEDYFGLGEIAELHIQKPILPSARKKEFKTTNFFVYTRGDHFGLVGAKRPDFFEDDFSEVLYVKRITRKQALEAERIDLNVVDNHSRSDSGTEDNDNDYNFVGTKYASDTEDEASEEKFQ